MNLHFRPAVPIDFDAIHALISALEAQVFDTEPLRRVYLANLEDSGTHYWVAVEHVPTPNAPETIVGFISLVLQAHLHHAALIGEIQELIITPRCRGTQIGQALLQKMETIARKAGAVTVELSTHTRRLDAHRFYKREGYAQSHYRFVKRLD
ncbi:MAG: aminoalkylphosphonate N-acetyltransferase [Zoogloeaceae bacterium]|nr:aminoalkylphosphonate N-acetyltransferase [Zoogloeaceae bacterium]